jgi:hypothetical protein
VVVDTVPDKRSGLYWNCASFPLNGSGTAVEELPFAGRLTTSFQGPAIIASVLPVWT